MNGEILFLTKQDFIFGTTVRVLNTAHFTMEYIGKNREMRIEASGMGI
jgi:hypothetical protein